MSPFLRSLAIAQVPAVVAWVFALVPHVYPLAALLMFLSVLLNLRLILDEAALLAGGKNNAE